jgi:TonB family protein
MRFSEGRVDARFGRRVRWVRPRFTIAGQFDAATGSGNAVVLAVSTNREGNVTNVEVLESSGSPETIDLPVIRAVYAWWIEPPKDRAGNAMPDTMVWRIEIR